MLIVNAIPQARGWSPIQHMVALAGELLECKVVAGDTEGPSSISKALALLYGRSRRGARGEDCLLVCAGPTDLLGVLRLANWRRRFGYLAAWIIDSFWSNHVPTLCRLSCPFDHLFVTTVEDVDVWRRLTGVPTTWLPWGADVLRYGSEGGDREWDVTRVGRQPAEWDDDEETIAAARLRGIKYCGRPGSDGMDALQNQRHMMKVYAGSKYVLAFSNTAHRERYTHPAREYLTGRWVDSVACGAVVAGIAPRGTTVEQLLWPGATLDLGSIRRDEGLRVLADALRIWSPDIAARNHQMALRQLDWRWRLRTIADTYGAWPSSLSREIAQLRQLIKEADRGLESREAGRAW